MKAGKMLTTDPTHRIAPDGDNPYQTHKTAPKPRQKASQSVRANKGAVTGQNNGKKQRKRRKCPICRKSIPHYSTATYCSPACRQKAYRIRKKQRDQAAAKTDKPIQPDVCAHCGDSYWRSSPLQKYCCASCRVSAAKTRRRAAQVAMIEVYGLPKDTAQDVAEVAGMKRIAAMLEQAGLRYDIRARRWISTEQPAAAAGD